MEVGLGLKSLLSLSCSVGKYLLEFLCPRMGCFRPCLCKSDGASGCRFLSFGGKVTPGCLNAAEGQLRDNIQTIQNTSQEGLFLHVSFIVGLPYETLADLAQTMTFIYEQI